MKKFLAGLLFASLLAPDLAWATYSCFGTKTPCSLGGIQVTQLEEKPVAVEKPKVKKKKSAKKPVAKKAKKVKKAKKSAKVYCDPVTGELKQGGKDEAKTEITPAVLPPVTVPEPMSKVPEVTPPPTPGENKVEPAPETKPESQPETKPDAAPEAKPDKRSDAAPAPGSLLESLSPAPMERTIESAALPTRDAIINVPSVTSSDQPIMPEMGTAAEFVPMPSDGR